MSRLLFAMALLLLCSSSAFAQKEYFRWNFGDGFALNFNAGSPPDTSLPGGYFFFEGSATMCHRTTGALLFYTNGVSVWDSQHGLMPNGDGIMGVGLNGDASGAQSALIIPMPDDTNKYYIFTADQEGYAGTTRGYHYSIVDMTLNSGRGNVTTTKNVQLMTTCSEVQTAVKHPNGRDYWVINHGLRNNYFYARLVTPSGISTAVTSQVGTTNYPTNQLSLGNLKASPNGRKLSYTIYNGLVEIYDFDPCTGTVSNAITLKSVGSGSTWAYSSSFSPNSKKLYFNHTGALWQYDVSLSSATAIQNSGTLVKDPADSTYTFYEGGLQLGPDGKIYVRPSYLGALLGIIYYPDTTAAACGFDVNAYTWPGGQQSNWMGLPNNIDAISTNLAVTTSISGDTVLCQGESSVLSAPSGPYTYLWSNNATTQTITVSSGGSYWVQVTDTSGCGNGGDTVQVTVNPKPQPVISPNGTSRICPGDSVTLTVSQTYAGYRWSNGATTRSIIVKQAGTYRVTVTDSLGCTGDTAVTVVVNTPPVPVISGAAAICQGDSTTWSVQSGFASYLWSTGATSRSIVVKTAGTYSVTVIDANGCRGTVSRALVVRSLPTPSISGNLTFCAGGSTTLSGNAGYSKYWWSNGDTTRNAIITASGTYTLTVQDSNGCVGSVSATVTTFTVTPPVISGDTTFCIGGTTVLSIPPSYRSATWSTGQTTSSITVDQPGTYSVTTVDSNGCISSASITVTQFRAAAPVISGDTIFCIGGTTVLRVSSSYRRITWSTGQTTSSITVTQPGTYSVTTVDSNGCISSASVTVTQFRAAAPVISGNTIFCIGGTTVLSVSSSYRSATWSTGQTTSSISVDQPGTYTVTVVDSNGCISSASITVTQFRAAAPVITGDTVFCIGGATVLSVNSNYRSITWSTGQTTSSISVTQPGTYSVTVVDSNGCISSASVTAKQFRAPAPVISGDTIFCIGGTTVLSVDARYRSATWSTGQTTSSITVDKPGTYSVTVVDSNGCISSASITVTQFQMNAPVIAGDTTFCIGGTTVLSVDPSFRKFTWSTGDSTSRISVDTAGTYSVTVIDSNGCISSASITVNQFRAPAPVITGDTLFCIGGTTVLSVNPKYRTFQWSTGEATSRITVDKPGTYTVTTVDSNGCISSASITVNQFRIAPPVISGGTKFCEGESSILSVDPKYRKFNWSTGDTTQSIKVTKAGLYSVTTVDSNGCISSASVTVTVFKIDPLVIAGDTMFCEGGTTVLSVSPKYRIFDWSTGEKSSRITVNKPGVYSVTVVDTNGCVAAASITVGVHSLPLPEITGSLMICPGSSTTLSVSGKYRQYLWSTGENTQSIKVNYGGTFSVTVIDSNGCTGTAQVTVVANTPIQPTITGARSFCDGESSVLSGQPGFVSYLWSTGDTSQSIEVSNAGTYTLTVTDANGCSGTATVTITVRPLPTPKITGALEFCEGERTTLDAGAGYDSYRWSTGETTRTIVARLAGTYTVTVSSNGGCEGTSDPVKITVHPLPGSAITASGPTTFCPGENVVLTAEPEGMSYRWSTGEITRSITVRDSGSYRVVVTSPFGCRDSSTIATKISRRLEPKISFNGPAALCEGESVELDAGVGYASYLWSTGETTQSIRVSKAGTYRVEVKSVTGCEGESEPVTIIAHPKPVIEIEPLGSTILCEGTSVGLRAGGGFISYEWSTGQTSRVIGVSSSGLYTVTAIDSNGCVATDTISILVLPRPEVIASDDASICPGDSTQLAATGGVSYSWAPTDGLSCSDCMAPMASPSQSTAYIVTATDAGGCSATDTVIVRVNTVPVQVRAHINDYYTVEPGKQVKVPVLLDDVIENKIDAARVRSFDFSLKYDSTVLKLDNGGLASMLEGTMCSDWRSEVIQDVPGSFVARLHAPSNASLTESGNLLNLEFSGYVGQVSETDIEFSVGLPDARCTEVISDAGKARIIACGLNFRLIELTGSGFVLKQNRPNPFNPTTIIDFSVPLDGYALLQVFDAAGREVTRLVDGELKSGDYSVVFDATKLPSGVYAYRLISSGMMRMQHMTVVK
jgi:hypothetical protein